MFCTNCGAIEENSFRVYSKYWLNDNKGACKDWQKVYSLGDKDAAEWIEEFC